MLDDERRIAVLGGDPFGVIERAGEPRPSVALERRRSFVVVLRDDVESFALSEVAAVL